MSLHIAICDDEKKQTAELEKTLISILDNQTLDYEISIFHTGEALCKSMENGMVYHLIFLDIAFAKGAINGVEVGKLIRNTYRNNLVSIVYMSWEMQYSMQLFEIRPFNFLIKPLDPSRIKDVVLTYLQIAETRRGDFTYKIGHSTCKTQAKDIVYFKSQGRKVIMFLADGSNVEFYGNLKGVYQQLQLYDFISIHASYLVNYDYIAGMTADKLALTTGMESLPISKTKSMDVREAYVAIMDKRRV